MLPLTLRVFAQKQSVPWADVQNLDIGDVVLLDDGVDVAQRPSELSGRLLLGRHEFPHVTVQCAARRVTVTRVAALKPASISLRQRSSSNFMSNPETSMSSEIISASTANESLSTLDAVCIDLEFELGAVKVPLATVQALAVGQVFELAHSIDGSDIGLWCGGHRLGSGQLIAVGDRLGVRIAELRGSRFATEASQELDASETSSGSAVNPPEPDAAS